MSLKDECISYAHVDVNDPDASGIYTSAAAYITNAIPEKRTDVNEANPDFCLAVKMLFAHWYDNRPAGDVPDGIRALITQLKYCGHRRHRRCVHG